MVSANNIETIGPFSLSAPPGTDIWRKPPAHDAFNAATHPASLPQYPLESFQRARVTFELPPGEELRQYDQAGLLLHFTKPGLAANQTKWLKTGIEWYQGKPYISTVSTDAYSDWSIVPIPEFTSNEARPGATIEARREQDALGKSLWVYWVVRDQGGNELERRPLREVNWVFAGDGEEEGWSVGVAGYTCRPTTAGGDGLLEAEFKEGLEIETLD
ncbi:hypothetical protein FA13DRAFT_1689506 [Coprinellus micaceus]|uniref:Uncharacterized protein n=1 Tax=Coprinellus micaceus TaxID=71717 RepID=A0A4Y7T8B9_COPMI|nr:hypothetical protein FA13DRAFT_1689506 [Coprinellus micaceus]